MQRVITMLLIFCLLLQSFCKLSIVTSYKLNKEFISQFLCINKSKPTLQCEGKCYLNKQLEQADEQEKAPAGDTKVKFEWLYLQTVYSFNFSSKALLSINCTIYFLPAYPSPDFSVFSPPKV